MMNSWIRCFIKFRHTNIDVAGCGFGEYSIYLRLNCRFNSEAFRSGVGGGGVGTNYETRLRRG